MGRLTKNSDKEKTKAATKKREEEEEVDSDGDYESCDEEEGDNDEEVKQQGEKKNHVSLYDLLDVEKGASVDEIKKSYKKLALKIHPDKNRDDPQAKEKFQKVVEAYNILSDPEKKKVYDETGSYGDDFNQASFDSAYQYYRTIYKKIEKKDIEDFEVKYRGSSMEDEDLINYYNENQGDMKKLLECIPLSRNEDVPRFLERYQYFLDTEKIKLAKYYKKTKDHIVLLDEDEEEGFAEEQENGLKDLAAQILARKGDAVSFLDQLAMKYGGAASKKTKSSNGTKPAATGKAKQKK